MPRKALLVSFERLWSIISCTFAVQVIAEPIWTPPPPPVPPPKKKKKKTKQKCQRSTVPRICQKVRSYRTCLALNFNLGKGSPSPFSQAIFLGRAQKQQSPLWAIPVSPNYLQLRGLYPSFKVSNPNNR